VHLFRRIERNARIPVTGLFPARLPRLYNTLDAPMEVLVQAAAYHLAALKYLELEDEVLYVGFRLGYGLRIMWQNARRLTESRRGVSKEARLC